jgi:EAL domain-containing protein (putative c-di-GMP-specific phosphodiesterase class I)
VLAPPFDALGHPVQLSATAGVVFTAAPVAGTELIQRADLVMQETRALGNERIGIEGDALHLLVAERLHRQAQLRVALDDGAIEPYYQGEWDLTADSLLGAEALARWRHEGSVIEAHSFIDLAEDSGLITDLGSTILSAACRVAASWPADLIVRVNVSARQLHEDDVFATVSRTLDHTGLRPERLCLELTETALLADPAHAAGILDAVRDLGVGLAIDDFGTGYSSLLYLKRLPVTAVKIDQSFVAGLPSNEDDRAIVRSVVQLADTLGITVTAEGVETDAQRQCLLDLGCTRAQGFLLSTPEPAGAFAARIRSDVNGCR